MVVFLVAAIASGATDGFTKLIFDKGNSSYSWVAPWLVLTKVRYGAGELRLVKSALHVLKWER